MINPFYKNQLIFRVSAAIAERRDSLLSDLIAYTQDPVRGRRRMNMLIHLSQYETQILTKIQNFETDDIQDLAFGDIMADIDRITDLSA